jgi:hypothetical protein
MKLFLAQINPTIGAFDETVRLIIQALDQAKKKALI